MSEAIDRAAEIIALTDAKERGYEADVSDVAIGATIARALDKRGLLLTDEAVNEVIKARARRVLVAIQEAQR